MPLVLEPGARLVVATHNPGKARELTQILENRFELVTAGQLGLAEPDETETTFVGNALLKARAAAEASGLVALADDSGLSVAAIGGEPGVYSARWAGPDKDFALAMRAVMDKVEASGSADRACWFTCALAVAWPGGPGLVVEGRIDGTLAWPPRGDRGFGYDPIFQPDGFTQTFGELDPAAKDAMSHRARAFTKLKAALL
ncbi:RdgB/HAM1 family non-canonical purine NTP pyrophosphatase [Phenylobacterium sp.]|uniref:RdgB/HAM1 family non-canonical purine NTP pyrophosphatase n=1 Tax=Phenylobacterium sp. TaxID=1871053 RepID=UPI0035AF318E